MKKGSLPAVLFGMLLLLFTITADAQSKKVLMMARTSIWIAAALQTEIRQFVKLLPVNPNQNLI
jgi:hypothetical protein